MAGLNAKLIKAIVGYYKPSVAVAKKPLLFVSYLPAVCPALSDAPTIAAENGIVTASAHFSDLGLGEITRCGFLVSMQADGASPAFYDANHIPTTIGEAITAQLTDLPTGIVYIASFAENAAGRAVSEFTSYRNSIGWEGGILCGVQPDAFTHFVVGDVLIARSKVYSVIVGNTAL